MPEKDLNNLARIGMLDKVPFSAAPLQKMLATAQTRLPDAQRTDNSAETRFDCAYTAMRVLADAAMHAQGWRHSKPGHHQTTVGCLVHSLGVKRPRRRRSGCDMRQPTTVRPNSVWSYDFVRG